MEPGLTDRDRSAVELSPGGESRDRDRDGDFSRTGRVTGAERRTTSTSASTTVTRRPRGPVYAALDLGTNNCRLLIARPHDQSFRVLDGFTRIVRLGEGLSTTGRLSDAAMARTMEALRLCRNKLRQHEPSRMRLIATEACRAAANGPEFVARVEAELGLVLEIVDRRTEAELAVTGCADLIERDSAGALMFGAAGRAGRGAPRRRSAPGSHCRWGWCPSPKNSVASK